MSELAILGGAPTRSEPYPQWPVFDERDIAAVTAVVRSGRWGGFPFPGPQTTELSRRFAEVQGGGHAVPMANGTVTLEVALRAAGIGWGDEVIVPAYTFQATAAAPMAAGAIPVIVDIDPDTFCMNARAAREAISDRTRAIIPVHLGAQMADMDAIMALAEEFDLVVIEDAAHAHGAAWRGRGAGTIGHFGSFSLQSSKTLTSGEGGILVCRSSEMADRVSSLIDCGRPHGSTGGNTMGANYRITELQSALANVGLERFPQQAQEREEMAAYMDEALSEIDGVRVLRRDPRHTKRSFYRYIFALKADELNVDRDRACAALEAEGIPCWIGYEAMHHYTLFQPQLSRLPVPSVFAERFNFEDVSFPEAERAAEREAIWLDESIFRAGRQGVEDAVAAIAKVVENAHALSAR